MLYHLGRYEEAIEGFNTTISYHPDFEKSYLYKTESLKALNYTAEALVTIQNLLDLLPDHKVAKQTAEALTLELSKLESNALS